MRPQLYGFFHPWPSGSAAKSVKEVVVMARLAVRTSRIRNLKTAGPKNECFSVYTLKFRGHNLLFCRVWGYMGEIRSQTRIVASRETIEGTLSLHVYKTANDHKSKNTTYDNTTNRLSVI